MLVRLLRPLAWLPLWLYHALGTLLGWLAWVLDPAYRRRLAENLGQSKLAKNGVDYNRLLRRSVSELGKAALEMPVHWLRPAQRVADLVTERRGWEHVEAALARPEPIIFVSPHLGGIEACGIHISMSIDRQLAALYRPPKIKSLEPLMLASRDREKGLAAPANAKGVRLLLKTLKAGQTVYLLPDQAPGGGDGVWAPFFERPAYTMTLLPRLARQFNATVLFCFAERLGWGRGYRLHVLPMQCEFDGDAAADAARMNAQIENLIRLAPTQYLWSYNRYKQPAGAPAAPELRT
ncbi:KDO2-lipid IV(A) lauroyltransferase [Andreprevotia lacus DSM 23236]|jgi:KDO2-lipid IV(A) lauroyltransferase|uniref:KDO2-lipid IV(A) lauroyltransferase n=1 Tax=Andreprevotia lacus DSM 23236 TaxID=1121001 RepID=A0A1W1XSE9_9NEIS|nr:lysophospholipid acyltransferase family protein [Andreprevotia lacus]SMC26448.1 KDO2-lipid IV(A) lauroyltransferase [Andreprevotia lacus DSM 23236]